MHDDMLEKNHLHPQRMQHAPTTQRERERDEHLFPSCAHLTLQNLAALLKKSKKKKKNNPHLVSNIFASFCSSFVSDGGWG